MPPQSSWRATPEVELDDIPPAPSTPPASHVMAPDEGHNADITSDTLDERSDNESFSTGSESDESEIRDEPDASLLQRDEAQKFLAEQADQRQNFTFRGISIGLMIGVIICFSNTYFGLQTGWVSGMTMPAALLGHAFFKSIRRCISVPFTPVENVLVQTVAGAVGTMPLGCGFVGVMPALEFLLKPEENGPLRLSTGKLIVWALGISFFGVVFAVPLRKEVIIREKLKFPSGTATALMIGVLHGNTDEKGNLKPDSGLEVFRQRSLDISRSSLLDILPSRSRDDVAQVSADASADVQDRERDPRADWKAQLRLMLIAFGASGLYTLTSYFIPQLHSVPIFGLPLAHKWLWTLNPSPAYVGQGIIMGPSTTLHMLLGALIGWGILSPLAKRRGWAPEPVWEWDGGSKGWIVWVSLAIMLADSVVSLGWLLLRPIILHSPMWYAQLRGKIRGQGHTNTLAPSHHSPASYTPLARSETNLTIKTATDFSPEPDAPEHHLVSNRTTLIFFILSIIICILALRYVYPPMPFHAILLSIILALLLGIMGVRALGETDLNPVSGISKLTQLFFALVIPATNPNAIIINLLAGAVSESGAHQAGDMMQDLKTGHLLGAAPKAQFWGQMIGSFVGAIVSAGVYKLYTGVYDVPGGLFQVPTAYVWIFAARLVTGQGLPDMAWQYALGAGIIFAFLTMLRAAGHEKWWRPWVPGGIAVAVGMYNVPSFTLARTIGGMINWYWKGYRQREETRVIVLASGLILGEGLISIVNLLLAMWEVKHL